MKLFKGSLRDLYTKMVIENRTFSDAALKQRYIAASVLQASDRVDEEFICNAFLARLFTKGPRDERGFFKTPKLALEGAVDNSKDN